MAQSEDSEFPSLSVKIESWIPILSRIPDSLSCISDSTGKISRIPESWFPFMGRTMGVNKLFRCRKTSNRQSNVRFNQNQKKSLGFVVDCNFCHFNASSLFIAI